MEASSTTPHLVTRHLYSLSPEAGVVTGLDGAIQRLVINGEAVSNLATRSASWRISFSSIPRIDHHTWLRANDAMAMDAYTGPPCKGNPCRLKY